MSVITFSSLFNLSGVAATVIGFIVLHSVCVVLCVCVCVCVLWREGGGSSHRTWLTVSGQMTIPFVVIFGMHQLPSSLLTGMTSM